MCNLRSSVVVCDGRRQRELVMIETEIVERWAAGRT